MLNLHVWHVVLTAVVLLFLGGFVGGRIAILSTLVRASEEMTYDISASLDQAANQMAEHPPDEWADWVIHLLKALDDTVGDDEYRATLKTIQEGIADRLKTGQWPATHM